MQTGEKMNALKLILISTLFTISGCWKSDKKSSEKLHIAGNEIVSAERFTLNSKNSWTEVKIINPWQGATNVNQVYYLVKRGYCCSNGCQNCPYTPKAIKGNRKLRPEVEKKYNP